MPLPNSLVKEFTEVIGNYSPESKTTNNNELYGTVTINNGKKFVKLDGSSDGSLTPISESMECREGDRVSVTIQNHKAIVNGNFSSPASARTATDYLQNTNDGESLMICKRNEFGFPYGNYIIISHNSIGIYDQSCLKLASFDADSVELARHGSKVSICGGHGEIIYDELNSILEMVGSKAVGIKTISNAGNETSITCSTANGIEMILPADRSAKINGNEILDTNNSIIFGSIKITNISIGPSEEMSITRSITKIPNNYILSGINGIWSKYSLIKIIAFSIDPHSKTVNVTIKNEDLGKTDEEIKIDYFAIRSNGNSQKISETVKWNS